MKDTKYSTNTMENNPWTPLDDVEEDDFLVKSVETEASELSLVARVKLDRCREFDRAFCIQELRSQIDNDKAVDGSINNVKISKPDPDASHADSKGTDNGATAKVAR